MLSLSAPLAGNVITKNIRKQFKGGIPCIPKPKRKYKFEKERIKQFSIWFEEVDRARQKEYTKRRHDRVMKEQMLASRVKRIRYLFILVTLFFLSGAGLLVFSNMKSVGEGSIFYNNRKLYSILGGSLVAAGALLLLVTEGLIARDKHKFYKEESEKLQCDYCIELPSNETKQNTDIVRTQLQASNTPSEQTHDLPQHFPVSQQDSEEKSLETDPFLGDKKETGTWPLPSDPVKPEKRRPPKLAILKAKTQGFQILESVDSSTSGATEYSYLENSNSSVGFPHSPYDQLEGACGITQYTSDAIPSTSGASSSYTRTVYELPYLERLESDDSSGSELMY